MRIIAGEFRGRRLLPPPSDATRPITDRAKQSLFDILAPLIQGTIVYDCFAGTGSMGLESLSRGAAMAVFFERDRGALLGLKRNIESLDVGNRTTVVPGDIFTWFGSPGFRPSQARRAGIVFLDPPYRFLNEKSGPLLALCAELGTHHLSDGGIVIFRHDSRDRLELPGLPRYDERDYGGMRIEFLRRV